MSIQQAPQLQLEKLNSPAEPIAIVQEYKQSSASKMRAERFNNQEIKIAQNSSEITKIGELDSKLVRERLRKDGLDPLGKPLGAERPQTLNRVEKQDSKVQRVGNIQYKKGTNDIVFQVNPSLSVEQQSKERDDFAKKVIAANPGNQFKRQAKSVNGRQMFRLVFQNPIK